MAHLITEAPKKQIYFITHGSGAFPVLRLRTVARGERASRSIVNRTMDRRVSDGAVVSTSFDVHIPQRGAGVFHLALASLPVSTIVSLKLRVGDQSPLR